MGTRSVLVTSVISYASHALDTWRRVLKGCALKGSGRCAVTVVVTRGPQPTSPVFQETVFSDT